jgi:subtilisin family serine protease
MPPFGCGQLFSHRKVLTSLLLALLVTTLASTLLVRGVAAQGWRGRSDGPRASWNAPRARWMGSPALRHGAYGGRFTGSGFPGGHRPTDHDARRQSDHQRAFGQRASGQRAFGAHNEFQRRPLPGEHGFTGVPPVGETRFRSSEMVFHVDSNVSPQAVAAAARKLGLTTVDSKSFSLTGGTLVHFRIADGRPVPDVIRALEAEKIGIAQPNYVFKLQQSTSLAALTTQGPPSQYVANKLRLSEVHRISIGSDVLVAVIDSEIDAGHPDLTGAVVAEYDAVGKKEKPHSHGTGMAGAIAAHRMLRGIAPGARILAIHAFSPDAANAEATTEHILRGIEWAIKKGARIINMSFAGPDDPILHLALEKAREKGVILIAAAGNAGPKSPPLYPGADSNVIAVTATDERDAVFAQANRGSYVALAAPGVNILEPAPSGGYQITTGTSVAAAHVSGVAALLLERNPKLDVARLREILQSSARDLGPKGRDDDFGWGLVDPYRALQALDSTSTPMASARPATQRASARPDPMTSSPTAQP